MGWKLASKGLVDQRGAVLVNSGNLSHESHEQKARKWLWIGLGAFVALQIYFVQQLVVALNVVYRAFRALRRHSLGHVSC